MELIFTMEINIFNFSNVESSNLILLFSYIFLMTLIINLGKIYKSTKANYLNLRLLK